jgi:alanyl-tRNA synthetase
MTERLYYTDSFLTDFTAEVVEVMAAPRAAVVLDRTGFYPDSGGQVHDTGFLEADGRKLRVVEVAEREDGAIVHYLEMETSEGGTPALRETPALQAGMRVRGMIDLARRRDHMQQHSGQHVISAAFARLFEMPTVSFHMGEESCSIDLATNALKPEQIERAAELANQVVLEDRPVEIRFATMDEARALGVRKLPDHVEGPLRLIDIRDFDLNACGGTHVRATGQIGAILLRKTEKVKQGIRVEFVCGERALATARRDFAMLTEAAGLYSAHIWDVPQQVRKSLDEAKAAGKQQHRLLEEIAELMAARLLSETEETGGIKLVMQCFADRETVFIKLLAQKLTGSNLSFHIGQDRANVGRLPPASPEGGVVALLGSTMELPSLVFAESPGLPFDMGALMKEAVGRLGGRGGGSREMAQGGAPAGADIAATLATLAERIGQGPPQGNRDIEK